jgi:hypothetical protein
MSRAQEKARDLPCKNQVPPPFVSSRRMNVAVSGIGPALLDKAREIGVERPPEVDHGAKVSPGRSSNVVRAIAGHFLPFLG